MDRIDGPTAVDIGGGRMGFRGKDTVAGVPGTAVRAKWLNAFQEEAVGFVEKTGQEPSYDDLNQLAYGIRSGRLNYFIAGGSASALTIAPPAGFEFPDIPSLLGVRLAIKLAAASPGAMTLAVGAIAPIAVKYDDATAIGKGDFAASTILVAMHNGTFFQVVGFVANAVRRMAMRRSRAIYSTPGAFSFTVPAGIYSLKVKDWSGAGGGGFGYPVGGAGSGGSPGAYAEDDFEVQPGWVITGSVGGGGTAGANGVAPGAGGDSWFVINGTTYTVAGGPAGINSNQNAGANSPSAAPLPTWGSVRRTGGQGSPGISASGAAPIVAGQGGSGYLGGAGGVGGGGIGSAGQAPGGGGGGSAVGSTPGAGARGEIIFEY